jgi:hypothetical protein
MTPGIHELQQFVTIVNLFITIILNLRIYKFDIILLNRFQRMSRGINRKIREQLSNPIETLDQVTTKTLLLLIVLLLSSCTTIAGNKCAVVVIELLLKCTVILN